MAKLKALLNNSDKCLLKIRNRRILKIRNRVHYGFLTTCGKKSQQSILFLLFTILKTTSKNVPRELYFLLHII